jgi:hypothetical protein
VPWPPRRRRRPLRLERRQLLVDLRAQAHTISLQHRIDADAQPAGADLRLGMPVAEVEGAARQHGGIGAATR